MASSVPSRISISTNQYRNEHESDRQNDEYTPLLRNKVSKSNTRIAVVPEGDVEAGVCSSPLGDKPRVEASRNIVGVISILLLGNQNLLPPFVHITNPSPFCFRSPEHKNHRTMWNTGSQGFHRRLCRKCRQFSCSSNQWDYQQRIP